jgi:hypothetical protein
MLMFAAGLEIDINLFRKTQTHSITFGCVTTMVSQLLGTGSMAPRISRRLPSRPAGMEYLRDLLAEHKRNRPPRGTERMVSENPIRILQRDYPLSIL